MRFREVFFLEELKGSNGNFEISDSNWKPVAPNRIVNQPMECNDADEVGNPTELTFDRYRKLAQGGAGIIIVEALTITQESRARKNQLGIYEKTAPALERLVKEMRGDQLPIPHPVPDHPFGTAERGGVFPARLRLPPSRAADSHSYGRGDR